MECLFLVVIQCATVTDGEIANCYNKHYSSLKKVWEGRVREKKSNNTLDLNHPLATSIGESPLLVIQCATATDDASVHCSNKFDSFLKKSKGGEG